MAPLTRAEIRFRTGDPAPVPGRSRQWLDRPGQAHPVAEAGLPVRLCGVHQGGSYLLRTMTKPSANFSTPPSSSPACLSRPPRRPRPHPSDPGRSSRPCRSSHSPWRTSSARRISSSRRRKITAWICTPAESCRLPAGEKMVCLGCMSPRRGPMSTSCGGPLLAGRSKMG